jgi:hypothetical protein
VGLFEKQIRNINVKNLQMIPVTTNTTPFKSTTLAKSFRLQFICSTYWEKSLCQSFFYYDKGSIFHQYN